MLNTLTKPRFQMFLKIFQGPTDRPTRLFLEAPPPSLKKECSKHSLKHSEMRWKNTKSNYHPLISSF